MIDGDEEGILDQWTCLWSALEVCTLAHSRGFFIQRRSSPSPQHIKDFSSEQVNVVDANENSFSLGI